MAADYNSNLIVELYSTSDVGKATRICDEMVSIGDPVFPRQIYEAYKKFKHTHISHSFVLDLTNFKTRDANEILEEIARETFRGADISMMLDHLIEVEYFHPEVVRKVRGLFEEEVASGETYDYDIDRYVTYLQKAGEETTVLENLLKTCFEDDRQSIGARKVALRKLLRLKPGEYIKFYYENYETIESKKMEVILVEEISTWHGGIVPSFHKKILDIGSERAKEILTKEQTKKIKEEKDKEIKEQKVLHAEYETSDIIAEIAELRSRINKIAIFDQRFGFPILTSSEEIYQQGRPARDKATLRGYCMVLRSLLGGFDERITQYEISEEKAIVLIPDLKDPKGSINKFHLFLLDKNIKVDDGLFGLRSINRIITKFAAHTDEETKPELIKLLEAEDLLDVYKEDNWSKLHREILLRYKTVLERLLTVLITKSP